MTTPWSVSTLVAAGYPDLRAQILASRIFWEAVRRQRCEVTISRLEQVCRAAECMACKEWSDGQ